MSLHPVVAVDGPAASGKSTFSQALARRLGFAFVSTGEMYRSVTWFVQEAGIDPKNADRVEQAVLGASFESSLKDGALFYRIAGVDPLPHVREGRVNEGVSHVARVSAVRRLLVEQQQALAGLAPVVMEGRDIGTVVFPQAPGKFYIDAHPEIRARRRAAQGEVDVILERDAIDTQRVDSPLFCAPDAVRLDSGAYAVDDLVEQALGHLRARGIDTMGS